MNLKLLFSLCLLPLLSPAQPAIGTQLHDSITTAIPAQKNQLIILDFFATWCSSCAKALPRLDSLQTQFGKRLSIRLVSSYGTADTKEKINAYFNRRKKPNGQPYSFTLIQNDSLLKNSFPHNKIPHYVWIYNGRLIAITRSKDVTASNIRNILRGKKVILPIKTDEIVIDLGRRQKSGNRSVPFSPLSGGDTEGVVTAPNIKKVLQNKTINLPLKNDSLSVLSIPIPKRSSSPLSGRVGGG